MKTASQAKPVDPAGTANTTRNVTADVIADLYCSFMGILFTKCFSNLSPP